MASEAEVYELFGRTAFKAQAFETSMKTLAMTMRRFVGEPFANEQEAQTYIDQLDKKTLGRVIGQVQNLTGDISDDILKAISAALDARNRIMHDFLTVNFELGRFETLDGRAEMMADLCRKQKEIARADELTVDRITRLHAALRKHGLMPPKID